MHADTYTQQAYVLMYWHQERQALKNCLKSLIQAILAWKRRHKNVIYEYEYIYIYIKSTNR